MRDDDSTRPPRLVQLPGSRQRLDAELDEEFRFHFEERIEEFMARGMSRHQAESEVRRRFGDATTHRQQTRSIDAAGLRKRRLEHTWHGLIRETVRSVRTLARTPTFAVVAVLTLALGFGATTAMFAVLDRVILSPLPYPEPEGLVSLLHPATVPGSGERRWGLSPGGYFHVTANNRSLESFGMYGTGGLTVSGDGDAEVAEVGVVTSTVFDVLRARPLLGRLIGAEDDRPDSTHRVVLGHAFWQRRFGGDRNIVGRPLQTSNGTFEIIGVTQPGLTLPVPGPFSSAPSTLGVEIDVWIPLKLDPAGPFWNNHPYVGLARLRPGISMESVQREFSALTAQLPTAVPNAYSDGFMQQYNFRAEVLPLRETVLGPSLPRTMWMLFAAVLLVLCIAAANVANLLMVRLDARRREVAVRTALGATRGHLALHYLSEGLVLSTCAAVAGLFIAHGALRLVAAYAPASVPRLGDVGISTSAICFVIGVAALVALVFGVAPVLKAPEAQGSLREEGRSSTATVGRRRLRNGLVVGQLALALVLLAGAGVLLRSFDRLRNVQPGFTATGVLAFDLSLPFSEYDTREKALVFHRSLADRIRTLPGVQHVGASSYAPLEGFGTGCSTVWRAGRPYGPGEETPCVSTPTALPGFFDALGIQVQGRIPQWSDIDSRSQAVVVTQALADRLWPGENPVGRGINTNGPDSDVWYNVVGVVPSLRAEAFDRPPSEAVFYAATSFQPNRRSGAINDFTWLVKTSAEDPLALAPVIRAIIAELNPRVPFVQPRTMSQVVDRSMSRTSFVMTLLGISAVVALLLSIVGTYGVVSYVVSQRRAELGVRLALGAPRQLVWRMVVVDSLRLGLMGAVIGVGVSLATNRLLAVLLFEVGPMDPVALAAAALLLVGCAVIAAFVPARRAAATQPVEVLRS